MPDSKPGNGWRSLKKITTKPQIMKKNVFFLSLIICFLTGYGQETGSITDSRDGKIYKTVKIGTQTWFAENLAFKADTGCWAYDDVQSNVSTYGYLYRWEAAKNACPAGWHLPTDNEWTILIDLLGGKDVAAGKLKAEYLWREPNDGNANDSIGFSGLPSGFRNLYGEYYGMGVDCAWWSITEDKAIYAWARQLNYDVQNVGVVSFRKYGGFSVRCIKDE